MTVTVAVRPESYHNSPTSGVFTHRQIVTILGGLMLGILLAALDQTIVSTAIRTIADDLHGLSLQAWATTAYLITATISTRCMASCLTFMGASPTSSPPSRSSSSDRCCARSPPRCTSWPPSVPCRAWVLVA
jgi:hypothetical protein